MSLTLLVLADPSASWLKLLGNLGPDVNVIVSNDVTKVRESAAQADVIVNGTSNPPLLSAAIPPAHRAKWIHSLWTGVDNVLCPEILASPLPLTNGRGVFRRPLAEWTIGAMLYFAYNMRRMIRQQQAGVWEAFTTEGSGQDAGDRRIRRDRQHGGGAGAAFWDADRRAAATARVVQARSLSGSEFRSRTDQRPNGRERLRPAGRAADRETRGMIGAPQIAAMKPTGV